LLKRTNNTNVKQITLINWQWWTEHPKLPRLFSNNMTGFNLQVIGALMIIVGGIVGLVGFLKSPQDNLLNHFKQEQNMIQQQSSEDGFNYVNNGTSNNNTFINKVEKVNVGNTQRHLNDEYKNKLTEFLLDKKPEIIKITATNNTESYQYAVEVKQFLEEKNFNVEKNVNQTVLAGGPIGINAQVEGNMVHIYVN